MLYIAADHGGFEQKKYLLNYIQQKLKSKIEDLGPFKIETTDDYPDFAFKLAKKVVKNKKNKGILLCRNGEGMCIAANKIKGARAMLGFNIEATEWARKDDHVNILCLPAEYLSNEHAADIVKKFLETEEDNDERFLRRLKKIEEIER